MFFPTLGQPSLPQLTAIRHRNHSFLHSLVHSLLIIPTVSETGTPVGSVKRADRHPSPLEGDSVEPVLCAETP